MSHIHVQKLTYPADPDLDPRAVYLRQRHHVVSPGTESVVQTFPDLPAFGTDEFFAWLREENKRLNE